MGRTSQRNVEPAAEAGEPERPPKALRPGQCQKYLQRKLAENFAAIMEGFVKEARKGGCAHVKLAVELLEPAKPARRRKSSAQRFLEELGE